MYSKGRTDRSNVSQTELMTVAISTEFHALRATGLILWTLRLKYSEFSKYVDNERTMSYNRKKDY